MSWLPKLGETDPADRRGRPGACPGCGHPLSEPALEFCPNIDCGLRLNYLQQDGGHTFPVHRRGDLVELGALRLRVESCLGQPNDATTVYRVALTTPEEFRQSYQTAPPSRLTLKEVVEGCRDRTGRTSHARIARMEAMSERLQSLRHPCLVRTYGYWTDGPRHYLLREYVEGETLESLYTRGARPGGGPKPGVLLALSRSLAEAIQYLHQQGLAHRDLSPSNVILRSAGLRGARGGARQPQPVLVDLESAVPLEEAATDPATFTRRYAPAELYRQYSHLPRDERIDQYYLGALLLCVAWGVSPYTKLPNGLEALAEAPARLEALSRGRPDPQLGVRFFRRDLPRPLAEAIDRMMAPHPENRFPSDAEMLSALKRGLTLPPVRLRVPQKALAALGTAAAGFLVGWTLLRPSWQSEVARLYLAAAEQASSRNVVLAIQHREEAQRVLNEHRAEPQSEAVLRARLQYGLACTESGWKALRAGSYNEAYRLATEAIHALGRANSASARELHRRAKAVSGR